MDRGASSGLDGPGTEEPRVDLALRRSPRPSQNGDRATRRSNSKLRFIPTDGGHSRGEGFVEGHGENRVRTRCVVELELETAEEGTWVPAADWEDEACKIM